MRYRLNRTEGGEEFSIPKSVIDMLEKLTDARLRIALTICKMGGEFTPHSLSKQLSGRYSLATLEKELHFLEGAGMIWAQEEILKPDRNIASLKPAEQKTKPEDILLLASTSNEMKSLVRLAQDILGKTLSGGDITILATLMFAEGMSVEMLALGIAHCAVEKNKPNIRYIDKVMRGWLADGVTDLPSAENYLEEKDRQEKLKKHVAGMIGVENVSYAESLLIIKWYKEFGYDDKMIKEAIMFAGEKSSVRYVNGILRRWNEQGHKTVKDVRAANTSGSNINTVKKIDKKDDVMIKRRGSVPVFRSKAGKADG